VPPRSPGRLVIGLALTCGTVAVARPVYANAGVPMLVLLWPVFVVSLIPVVFLESYVVQRMLAIRFRKAIGPIAVANLVSTLVGIPMTWGVALAIQIASGSDGFVDLSTTASKASAFVRQFAWLPPYDKDLAWMIPAASVLLLLLFFATSCLIEIALVSGVLRKVAGKPARFAVLVANVVSYLLLIVMVGMRAVTQIDGTVFTVLDGNRVGGSVCVQAR